MFRLLGKTHVPHRKNTADMPAVRMPAPTQVLLPMAQHIGAPATPIVKVGDRVSVGQRIADPGGYVSSPIYASVSGTVTKIEMLLCSNGRNVPAVRIQSDGEMRPLETITPPDIHDFDSFSAAVRDSGLVGLGGAGFPTAVKLDAQKKGLIDTVLLNGAECEPYITSDTRTMLDQAESVYEGVKLLMTYLSAKRYIIGIEKNKPACIAKMREVFRDEPSVEVLALPARYPQGGEKVLIYNATGRIVPEGKLPADVGVLVANVTSVAFLASYVKTGMPLVEKCVTVDGSAIREPKNVIVPIGTSIADLIEFAGGFSEEPGKIMYGGPMMGVAVFATTDPVLKTTNAITALNRKEATPAEPVACIHCGRCVEHCPMGLIPTKFSKHLALPDVSDRVGRLEDAKIGLCIECGCCSFVCPSKRPLVQNNRLAKAEVREHKAHQATLK